jgi:hypothetical protein
MEPVLVVGHPGLHQEARDPVLHLNHLPHQQMPVAQSPAPISDLGRGHMALRKEITAETVGNLAGIDTVILFFAAARCADQLFLSGRTMCGDLWHFDTRVIATRKVIPMAPGAMRVTAREAI